MKVSNSKNLETELNNFLWEFRSALAKDIITNEEIRKAFLKSYNFYQDEERDGVDYIFNITDREDVCNTDLEVGEVYDLYHNFVTGKETAYFLCGCNYETPKQFHNANEFIEHLVGWVDEVCLHIIAHPSGCDGHDYLYGIYVARFCYE